MEEYNKSGDDMRRMNIGSYLRQLVVGVDTRVPLANGEFVTAINFDNAATTPPLFAVMKEINDFAPWYGSVHRGKGCKSILTSDVYEEGRQVVKKLVNADAKDAVIFTKSTTESINILAYALASEARDQIVLTTDMEHLANDLPWRGKFQVEYVCLDKFGRLSLSDLEAKLVKYKGRVRLVTVVGASNVTGYINPVHQVAELAHKYGAEILVDSAQLVPHAPFDMKPLGSPEHIDYLAFSAHKMYAPFGTGVLIGRPKIFTDCPPVYQGGGAVGLCTHQFVQWDDVPAKYEAGTPNMLGVLALMTSIRVLTAIGLQTIHHHEKRLIDYAIDGLGTIPGVKLYSCCESGEERVSLISFTMEDVYHSLLAQILSQEGAIAVRNGLFCAHPYVEKLLKISNDKLEYCHTHPDVPVPGLVRVSFGMYNNCEEIDVFIELMRRIAKNKDYYISKYKDTIRCQAGQGPCDNRSSYC